MPASTPQAVSITMFDQWNGEAVGFTPRLDPLYANNPRPTVSPYDLPLATLSTLTDAYIGGFKVTPSINGLNTDGESVKIASSEARIAYKPSNHSLFITSQAAGRDNDSIINISLPTDGNLTTDPLTFPEANSILQGWTTVMNNGRLPTTPNTYDDLGGLFYNADEDALYGTMYQSYSGGSGVSDGFFKIVDASNIGTSVVQGAWQVTGHDQASNWISELPQEWKFELGVTHIHGNGAGMSNQQRYSRGPSAWLTDHSAIDFSGSYNEILQTKLMSFPYGQFGDPGLGTAIYGDFTHTRSNYNEYNNAANDGSAYTYADEIVVANPANNIWTRMSSAGGGFIIPGTRSYCAIGQLTGGVSGGGYKVTFRYEYGTTTPLASEYTGGGPSSADPDDHLPYYWLFDMVEMRDATDKSAVLPYSFGQLPFALNLDELPRSAICDPMTGRAFIACAEGAFGSGGNPIQVLQLQFAV